MNQIPNIITSVRLIAALAMVTGCTSPSAWKNFIFWFVAAGVSDMLDGVVARRFNWCSKFGAHLDSISDLALYLAVVATLWTCKTSVIIQSVWILYVGLILQWCHIWYCQRKFQTYPSYHSHLARAVAYAMFFLVLRFYYSGETDCIKVSLLLWCLCSVEGILITRKLKESRENVAGLWAIASSNQNPHMAVSE